MNYLKLANAFGQAAPLGVGSRRERLGRPCPGLAGRARLGVLPTDMGVCVSSPSRMILSGPAGRARLGVPPRDMEAGDSDDRARAYLWQGLDPCHASQLRWLTGGSFKLAGSESVCLRRVLSVRSPPFLAAISQSSCLLGPGPAACLRVPASSLSPHTLRLLTTAAAGSRLEKHPSRLSLSS
jgi:hypothetical protein